MKKKKKYIDELGLEAVMCHEKYALLTQISGMLGNSNFVVFVTS